MKTIAVVFGGRSVEHDVSIITGQVIIEALRAAGHFKPLPVYIARDGSWYADEALGDITFFQQAQIDERLARLKRCDLRFENGLLFVWPGLRAKQLRVEVVFPSLHGTYGEDGSLMGLLRMAGVPFVGCDLFASAIAMDKVLTKQVTESAGLPSVNYQWFSKLDWEADQTAVQHRLGRLRFPLFVKPAHLGSSIGINKANDADGLLNAIEVALHYDDKVIVEEGVVDLIEVTVPVMGNEQLRCGLVERALNKSELFNFEDKYLHGGKKVGTKGEYSELPAKIDSALIKESERVASGAFKAIGGSGIARVDLLIDAKAKRVYLNEINTLPGSLYHHNWKAAGVSPAELVTELVRLAEQRFAAQQSLNITFDSSILNQTQL